MGAFIGYGDVGVWAGNRERDDFLDWFAEHRCAAGDARWEFCKSESNRWMGCGIQLQELIPRGERFEITPAELEAAAQAYSPDIARLLELICQITRGEWQHDVGSREAVYWRPGQVDPEESWRRLEEEVWRGPFLNSSFGAEGQVRFRSVDEGG